MEPGSVCDTIPEFDQKRTLVWIEYPGIIKNVDKMIKTLGGSKNINSTYREANKRIDLRYRPDDPCCHPVCGDRTPVTALVLKVRKYKKKKKPGESSEPDMFRYRPEIVGVVETSYKFNSLCDFQYLPLYNDVKNDKLINMIPFLQVKDLSESVYTADAPLFLPPPTFSRFDQQQDVLFRNEPKYKKKSSPQTDKIGVTRPRRANYAQYIKFEDKWTPKEPLPKAKEVLDKVVKAEETLVSGVRELFEQRPVWSKNAIICQLKCHHERLKNILPSVAYYFITGPWRSLWVRFGYDPRVEPEAVKYQLLDFRVRQGLNTPNIPIKAKRSTLTYRLPNLLPRARTTPTNVVSSLNEQIQQPQLTPRSFRESVYIYKPGVLPAYRQTFYQVCDIHHPDVMSATKTHFEKSNTSTKCNPKSGWLPEDMAAKVRDILSKDVQQTITKNDDAQTKITGQEKIGQEKKKTKQNKPVASTSSNLGKKNLSNLGILPESSNEEEKAVDIDDAVPSTETEDPLLEEDDEASSSFKEIDEDDYDEQEFDETKGFSDEDADDLADFMDDFDAYSPENLLEAEFDDEYEDE